MSTTEQKALELADRLADNAEIDAAEGGNPDVIKLELVAAAELRRLSAENEALRFRLDGAVKAAEEVFGQKAIRYKFSLDEDGRPYASFPPEMDGRWFALQPAEDDAHIGLCDELVRLRAQMEALTKPAARWNWLSDHMQVHWSEGKFTSLVRIVSEEWRAAINASVDRMMAGNWSDADQPPTPQALTRPAVPEGWRELAAQVMDALAEAQEQTNASYPDHVKCYPQWVSHARWCRWHAEMFRTGKPIGNGAGNPKVLEALAAAPQPSQQEAVQPTAEDWLRTKYGAYRGHPEWRALEAAFIAGMAAVQKGGE